ncbi:family 16 glycosylhydrolase [Parabacteroides sp. OttesenSCG-928-G06]|nr:family 16 glycosylhydrolase [Parabacteroides sp. OttesenSCG-928-K15]MDL2281758.1 family 16 glycosylhydrolase [Parabacteroides sp. OttesenSCG-928-G06]
MKKKLLLLVVGCGLLFACAPEKSKVAIPDIPTTEALPKGMKLVWGDEFNDKELDRTKWFTQYYSQFDYISRTNWDDFRANNLPEPGMLFTDSSIVLITNDSIPLRTFWRSGRKISSIQTYDWNSDRITFDNRLGGYMEARIRRNATEDAKQVNGAFWIDSPGPDARYFVEKGNNALDVEGIRPRGQVFEIDLCEYITTELVLHGNVSPEGKFERNIGHHIEKGDFKNKWVVHSMLWTPAGLKFYIDGKLIREWWDPEDIKSPNHKMSIFLGAYGNGGTVSLECDYIRFYQWELDEGNELPNGGFEYGDTLFPWEGEGRVEETAKHSGKNGLTLPPGKTLWQYVYLEHSQSYAFSYYAKGGAPLEVAVENITQVTGKSEDINMQTNPLSDNFAAYNFDFSTLPEYGDHLRTVKVSFTNKGDNPVSIDDIIITKSN